MASTQVSFDFREWKRIHDWSMESDLTGFYIGVPNPFRWKGEMITFEQVTKIEALRRQIEMFQSSLGSRAGITDFQYRWNSQWVPIPTEDTQILREALCKLTVARIIKLLDESEHLGVDVTEPKKTLLEFLEEIKPKQEIVP